MSEEKKHRIYTAADIEKYHKGLLSPKEMHELEKAALDDLFLADALEGYAASSVNISKDLPELEKKLEEKIAGAKVIEMTSNRNSFKWWKVAAAIVIIGGIGYFTFGLLTGKKNKEVAILGKKKDQQPVPPIVDSNKLIDAPIESKKSTAKTISPTIESTSRPEKMVATETPKRKSSATSFLVADSNKNDIATSDTRLDDANVLNYKKENNDSSGRKTALGYAAPLAKAKSEESNRQPEKFKLLEKQNTQTDRPQMNYFRGQVTDANNSPLPFANITNMHDNVGTYADAQGNFTLISTDSVLNVQVRSIGFENNFTRLRNNVASNKVVLRDDKAAPDKIISYQKPDTARSRNGTMKLEEPEPADGWTRYDTYLANNIKLPDDLKLNQRKGQVELSFEVNQNGDPVNIKVEKSLCQKCDEEAVRLVKQGPKWKKKNKKAKRVTVTVPFETNE
jgi:TonB family protein